MNMPSAEARYFGAPAESLFGWLHRADAQVDSDLALVICNPFGFEEVCMHRSLRQLAIAAARAGTPALRFDYAGCGHSCGDEGDGGDQTLRWIASIHCAIDAVKRATGASRVVLLGVRLGAALATLAAVERTDVHGLVLLAPVVRGRAYLRELTLLGGAAPEPADSEPRVQGVLESAGFTLSAATCDALSRVDLRSMARAPAADVVIIERDDLPATDGLATAWERLGARSALRRWPGYAAMANDPQRAVAPQQIIDGVVGALHDWRQRLEAHTPRQVVASEWGTESFVDPKAGAWAETVVNIEAGNGATLFGVMCRPSRADAADSDGPALLLLNAGSVHAIGPNRLWVCLARRWAARGIRVLRIDISGIGDSAARADAEDNVVYSLHAMSDVSAALDHLRQHEGASACHVMGLCSGAYHAFKAATGNWGVDSALMINPLTYFWVPGTPLTELKDYEVVSLSQRYRSLLLSAQAWRRLLQGDLDLRAIGAIASSATARGMALALRGAARWVGLPVKDDLARELRRVSDAGVRLRFVFAANAPGYTLLAQQSGRALATALRRGTVALTFVRGADHTFTRADARSRLLKVLDQLVAQACGRTPP
jgi:alpha-beta hydrolase superfamily lysophospholipase